jgi:hypothetical protein
MKKRNRKLSNGVVRATEPTPPVVHAAGNSEGAKKGWESRLHKQVGEQSPVHRALIAHGYKVENLHDFGRGPHAVSEQHYAHPDGHTAVIQKRGMNKKVDVFVDSKHEDHANDVEESLHNIKAGRHHTDSGVNRSSDTEDQEPVVQARQVVHCRNSGSPIQAKKTWEVDKPIDFMWMPGGVHTIHASYGRSDADCRPIELTVLCDEGGGKAVQAAFEAIRAASPRRPPFICVEHKAQERAGEPVAFEWRNDPEPAIYCRCMPSALGANNVNGKIHTSFSPTFDTDAEYHKMLCTECEKTPSVCACDTSAGWYFPDGARGSRSLPARVTAPDVQSVGSLTNWNAFRDMLPVAAREKTVVQAAGNSEGAKKGWESRLHSHGWEEQPHLETSFGRVFHHPKRRGEIVVGKEKGDVDHYNVHENITHSGHVDEIDSFLEKLHKKKDYSTQREKNSPRASDTEEQDLAVRAAEQANTPQPETTNVRDMLPVAAREKTVVQAAGTSEGVKKAWETRKAHEHANDWIGLEHETKPHHIDALAHTLANDQDAHNTFFHFKRDGKNGSNLDKGAAEKLHKTAKEWSGDEAPSAEHLKGLHWAASMDHDLHKKLRSKVQDLKREAHEAHADVHASSTEEQDLAVRAAEQANTPQPETTNADEKGQTMKVKFVRAAHGFAVGAEADLDVNHAAILAGDALVPAAADAVMAREAEFVTARNREKESNKAKIIAACDRAQTRGAILAVGETEQSRTKVEAKYVGRFERNECSADIAVEAIDALPVVAASEPGRQTTANGNTRAVEAGEVSGNELAKASIRACEPFQAQLRNGGLVKAAGRGQSSHGKLLEAIDLSREKTRLLAKLNAEMAGGYVIRAATLNYVDPAANNPLGLLNTELMVLNNLGHLENQLAPVRDLTTNLTGTPVAFNQQVRTRYFAIPKVQLKTSTTAWTTTQTGGNTDVNVKLDTYAGVPISFENTMLASSPRALFREQHDPQLYGLGEYILYKLINTIFNGNTRISNDDSTTATIKFQDSAARRFDISGATLRTFVSDLPAKLDLLKMPGGDEPPGAADLMRFAWVHTRPYAAATADTNFVLNQSIQAVRGTSSNGNVMETGLFERLGNLKFRKSQLMADGISVTGSGADAGDNGISVNAPDYDASSYIGFAGTRSSMLFVSRVPEDYTQVLPNIPSTAAVETVTSPQLGITFLMVKYLDHAYEIANARIQLMFGFAIGDERQGCLLYKV